MAELQEERDQLKDELKQLSLKLRGEAMIHDRLLRESQGQLEIQLVFNALVVELASSRLPLRTKEMALAAARLSGTDWALRRGLEENVVGLRL